MPDSTNTEWLAQLQQEERLPADPVAQQAALQAARIAAQQAATQQAAHQAAHQDAALRDLLAQVCPEYDNKLLLRYFS